MTTTEYLKQRGIELLDFFGIKPTSSLVIKTLRGEVLTIEHRLPKAEEKEFIEEFLQGKPSIPAVQIERVQFPNDLNGTEAADLEHKVRIDQAYYERKQEYVFETNFGLSFSREDWNRQCWRSKTYDSDKSEYLIAVRDKSTPDRKIIGHSTHSSEKEIEAIQGSFSKYKDIDSKDTAIETYIIFNSNDPEYKKAKTENLERYLDDPRNKVSLINVIDIPETVLIYSNENNIHKLYSGNNIFQDFYNENYNKPGTASVCTTDALHMLSDCIKYKIPLKEIDFMKIENQFFAPELNYYIHSRISNNMDIDKRDLYEDTINEEVKQCYTDYRAFLKEHNLSDIPRDLSFINEAVMYNPSTLEILTDKEKQGINWQDLLESSMESPLKYMPKELITFDLLYKANYYEPEMIYKHLPSSFTNEQIVKLIEKNYRSENSIDNNGLKLSVLINALPNDLKNKGLVSELHKQFDKTDLLKELAYSLIELDLEKNNKNAINAMEHFKNSRFIIDYDPCGFDNSWGQVCGGEYYTNSNMLNPADKFEPDLLTIKQWHDIASQDTRMLEFIPESIIKEETFWENYQDFIGKGGYLNNPDNDYCMDKFDEYQVFSKMPEHLKTNPDICRDLLEKKAISLSFIKNPTEEHYLLVNPQDYDRIPLDLREKDSFKDLALKAFSIEKWNILNIPEKFITQEMVSEALSHDMELCNRIPIHYLSEELLCDKIKNYKHQGAFSEINRSGEHPQYIEYELSNHKKVLQYVPEELKTDLVCQAALKANPENAAFLPKNHLNNNTMNDLKIENLHLRELNKDEIDILHKIQMSGRVVDPGISEGNKDLIDKYFSQDNKELITAIENDDSGMIADIEGRRRLTAGEILESKGIIPGGTTAKTLEEEGYKVELLKSKINSKTENHLGVDKTNMKTVNNNDPMTGKKQSVPLNTLGEVKTAQKSQGKMNITPATGNILHSNHKDKLSNSNKISKSHTNNRDSNRKRRGHKL